MQVYKPAKCCLSYLVKNFVLAIYIAASSSWRTDVHPSGQGVERKERFYPRYYYSTIALLYEGFVGVALGFGTAAICSKLQSAVLIARWLFLFYRQRLRWLNTSVSPTVRYPAKTLKSMTVATCPTQGQSIWPLIGLWPLFPQFGPILSILGQNWPQVGFAAPWKWNLTNDEFLTFAYFHYFFLLKMMQDFE